MSTARFVVVVLAAACSPAPSPSKNEGSNAGSSTGSAHPVPSDAPGDAGEIPATCIMLDLETRAATAPRPVPVCP